MYNKEIFETPIKEKEKLYRGCFSKLKILSFEVSSTPESQNCSDYLHYIKSKNTSTLIDQKTTLAILGSKNGDLVMRNVNLDTHEHKDTSISNEVYPRGATLVSCKDGRLMVIGGEKPSNDQADIKSETGVSNRIVLSTNRCFLLS